ncbi:MAG: DUF551 domain-containing protein [Acutalibacter sp.]
MARMIDAYQAIDIIDEWLDSVGTVMVGKGLSSYGELIGCIEEAPTLTQPNEWVSVVERLPEEEIAPGRRQVTVLVCSKAGRVSSASRVWWPDRGWRWSKMMNNYVTHWMPLPTPPDCRPPEGEEEP